MGQSLSEFGSDHLDLEQLLVVEDDPSFAAAVEPTTGILAWPAVRQAVFRLLLGDRLRAGAPLSDIVRRPSISLVVEGGLRAAIHNSRHRARRTEVLIMATGAGLVPIDGRSFNRLADPFAEVLGERAWTVESLFDDHWPAMPRANRRLGFAADHRLELAIRARFSARPAHRRLADELIDLAAQRGRDRLGWDLGDERRRALAQLATRRLAGYAAQAMFARRLIRRVRPRLVLVEDGSFGNMAAYNATLRELGVTVAEFQHGLVTRNHEAYNVAPALRVSPAYRLTQPTAFLGYGSWWNAQFNAPVDERVVIGNPHRSETLRSWRAESNRPAVVVLGDGFETDAYLAFCRRLAPMLPSSLQLRFRPHPVERRRVVGEGNASVAIDDTPDLYASLATAAAVVGEASTALLEAVGTVPRIFIWDTAKSRFYFSEFPFQRFTEPEELAAMLSTAEGGVVRNDVAASLWADDWRGQFLRYVDQDH